jgi:hypothetical protein
LIAARARQDVTNGAGATSPQASDEGGDARAAGFVSLSGAYRVRYSGLSVHADAEERLMGKMETAARWRSCVAP